MKSSVSTVLVFVLIVAIIIAALWLMDGSRRLGGAKISDSAILASGGTQDYAGTTPPGTMYPDANGPASMAGNTEGSGGVADVEGGEAGSVGGYDEPGSVGESLYFTHDISVNVEGRDDEQVWSENAGLVRQVNNREFDVYVLDPATTALGDRVLEVLDFNDAYAPAHYLGDLATSRGWAAKFRVVLPGPGRYFIWDSKRDSEGGYFTWFVELR